MYENKNPYQNYQNMPYDNTQPNSWKKPEKAPNSGKKGSGLGKKLLISALCAVIFGTVAGGTMVGVNRHFGLNAVREARGESSGASATNGAESLPSSESKADETKPAAGEKASQGSTEIAAVLDVSGIVEKAMPSVVAIDVTGEQRVSDWFGRAQTYETTGAGSGILIGENDKEYLIVTNNHVIENTKTMSVQFIDGKGVDAELKGTDSGADVAVIAVKKSDVPEETRAKIRIAEVGDSNALKVGQGVIAIGNALGYGQSVTVGYVSAMGRSITARDTATGETATIKNLLQTDAAINPGNSGGALLNMHGQVIGINESKSVDTTVEGMGYAIPILSVTDLIDNLSAQKTRAQVAEQDRGYIGFQGQNVDQEAARKFNMPVGIFVYKILKGGAAANSKLQESDIITKFEGQTVSSIEELKDKLTRYQKGEVVHLTVQRPSGQSYKEVEVEVTLAPQGESDQAEAKENGKTGDPDTEESEPEESGPSGFGGFWDDFFRNGGFHFRW